MKVLVTGGGGFLGSHICKQLRFRGHDVVSIARNRYPALDQIGVRQVLGDISAFDPMLNATKGCDAVIHTAARAGIWGSLADYSTTNIGGTVSVLGACEMNGVRKIVYTSTPSVVHSGADIENGNESLPYAAEFKAHYPATKAAAERLILQANGPNLATVALRPHLIWGPGDNHLLPRLVQRARAGKLRFIGPSKKIDTVYIDNAVQAHMDALDRLEVGATCAGKAYFISQGQPIALDEMVNKLLKAVGLPAEQRRVSIRMAKTAGFLYEQWYRLTNNRNEPPMTRFLAEQLSSAHWFNIGAARRDLGYQPKVTLAEGMVRVSEWWLREGRIKYPA
ncbi:MAG: NAD-dependent epimerase/dehydratase family protein [Pseudomonadota bacterium]|nr:NAD-dependent epimerase/dehydratase family protein [Pseudomonadota bacterium]